MPHTTFVQQLVLIAIAVLLFPAGPFIVGLILIIMSINQLKDDSRGQGSDPRRAGRRPREYQDWRE